MSATPYVPLSWADTDPLSTQRLDQMTSNDQWLFENTPRALYNAQGAQISTGVKFLGGIVSISAGGSGKYVTVTWGTYFSAGCVPIITCTPVTTQGRMHVWVTGIGHVLPDNSGFQLFVTSDERDAAKDIIQKSFYVNYIAIGW